MKFTDQAYAHESIRVNEPHALEDTGKNYFSGEGSKGLKIKDMADNERPMEKLVFFGAQDLSDVELLAIIIGSGTRELSAIDLAYKVLAKYPNHELLMELSPQELMKIKGIGKTKATRIVASLEFGKRLAGRKSVCKFKITSPEDIYNLYKERFKYENKEHFFVVLLDTKNQITGEIVASTGDLNSTIVSPREIFKIAVKRSANSIMLLHNHPSGDPRPSQGDINVTHRLQECGDILGIKVLDHIIIGYDNFFSMKRENII